MCHTMPNTQSTRVRIAVAITCKGCLMSIVVVISVWFWFFYLCGSKKLREPVFHWTICHSFIRHFFIRFPVAWVLSVSVAFKGAGISDCKDFRKNTTRRCGDFCRKQEACPCHRVKIPEIPSPPKQKWPAERIGKQMGGKREKWQIRRKTSSGYVTAKKKGACS